MENRSFSLLSAKLTRHMLKKAAGFTLIELLVVIVIVGVLSAVAVPTFLSQIRRSRAAEAEGGLATFATAATVYAFDCGTFQVSDAVVNAASGYNCGITTGKVFKASLDQPWSILAPNYTITGFTGTISGATAQVSGTAPAYASITCQKGIGNSSTASDGCTLN